MQKSQKIHVAYILGILVSIIIFLLTIKWGAIPKLVELISFALTISSLVLAILAIIYAVYSNNSFNATISKLDIASNDISTSTGSLLQITNNLESKFDKMPTLLETIDKKTDTAQLLLTQLSEKGLNTTETKFVKSNSIEKENIRNIVTKTSINGNLILYALKLAKESKKEFTYEDLATKADINKDYLLGYLSPLTNLGLIKIETHRKEGIFFREVTGLHDDLYENILNGIKVLWTENKKEKHMHFVLDNINLVRIYFNLPPIEKEKDFD